MYVEYIYEIYGFVVFGSFVKGGKYCIFYICDFSRERRFVESKYFLVFVVYNELEIVVDDGIVFLKKLSFYYVFLVSVWMLIVFFVVMFLI